MSNKMPTELRTPPGFRDFLPEEAKKRQWLRQKLEEIFELWGYDPIETPTLEMAEFFTGQIGEDEKLFFRFIDQGEREVMLRYDQTVPASRVVAQYQGKLPMPFRRYQIQPNFRAEKPQKGRYREFFQADADIFGSISPYADAEVIALSMDIYRRLGFKEAKVLINDRSLLKDFPYEAIVAIDKLQKIGPEGVVKDMVDKKISEEKAKAYLETAQNLKPNETIKIITNYLTDLGFENDWYEFSPTLARSFSYSSGPIWEVVIPEYGSGSVLGGERYDNLIEKISGTSIPATGFALGFDRTLEAADELGLIPKGKTTTKVLVTIFSSELREKSAASAKFLRDNNIKTELYPIPDAKLDKQLKYADQKGIPYVVIIGPEEAEKDLVTVKNLQTKEQKTFPAEDLIDEIKA